MIWHKDQFYLHLYIGCFKAAHIDTLPTANFAPPIHMPFLTLCDCVTGTTKKRRRHRPDRTVSKNCITPRIDIPHRYQDFPHDVNTDKRLRWYLRVGLFGIACVSRRYTIEKRP